MQGYCNLERARLFISKGKSSKLFREECQNKLWTNDGFLDRGVSGSVSITCVTKNLKPGSKLEECGYVVKEQKDNALFRREVLILEKLSLNNITRPNSSVPISPCIFDHWICGIDQPPENRRGFMVLQRLRGGNMKGKRITPLIQKQIGELLSVLHSLKITFLDLNPGNVLLDGDGLPYLSDFGLSEDFSVSPDARRRIFGVTSVDATFQDAVREDNHKLETVFAPTTMIHWRTECLASQLKDNEGTPTEYQSIILDQRLFTMQRVYNLIRYYKASRIAEKLMNSGVVAELHDDFTCENVGYLVYKQIFKYPNVRISMTDMARATTILRTMHSNGVVMGWVRTASFGVVDTNLGGRIVTEMRALDLTYAVDYGSLATTQQPLEVQVGEKTFLHLSFDQAVQNDLFQLDPTYRRPLTKSEEMRGVKETKAGYYEQESAY